MATGVQEINVISQDLSDYGSDLDDKHNIDELLSGLEQTEAKWIRLFYYYPDELSDKAIDIMAKSTKICPYLDMPVQHFSDKILKRMNRKITSELIFNRLKKLRERIPNITIRTSVIVGFPGETEEDFKQLFKGIKEAEFDHLGVFKYSDEEGTPAYNLKDKVSQDTIDKRFEEIYELQKEISKRKNQRYLGRTIKVMIEGAHPETELLLQGRHIGQAPDIDGHVIINEGFAYPGQIVDVAITEAHDYDLIGCIVEA